MPQRPSYTDNDIRQKCEEAKSKGMARFYKSAVVNYKTLAYSDIVAEFLLEKKNHNLNLLKNIEKITREESYKREDHKGIQMGDETTIRGEEWMVKAMFGKCYPLIGEVIDYQTPIKNTSQNKDVGRIDLLTYSREEKTLYLVEAKASYNDRESILRGVLEIYTYSKQIDLEKLKDDFTIPSGAESNTKVEIVPVVAIFKDRSAHNHLKKSSSQVLEVIEKLNVKIALLTGYVAKKGEDPRKNKIDNIEWWSQP